MLIKYFCLLYIIVSFYVCNACNSTPNKEKRITASWSFLRIRSDVSTQCQYINNNFDKLKGLWYYILRTVASKNSPTIHCGRLIVTETSENGFESTLIYLSDEGELNVVPIIGIYINETVVLIPKSKKLITGTTNWKYPFIVQMGICDNDTIFFFEPIHYHGGSMVFTREIPDNIVGLKLRFGTYNEDLGKESTVQVDFNCTKNHSEYCRLLNLFMKKNNRIFFTLPFVLFFKIIAKLFIR